MTYGIDLVLKYLDDNAKLWRKQQYEAMSKANGEPNEHKRKALDAEAVKCQHFATALEMAAHDIADKKEEWQAYISHV